MSVIFEAWKGDAPPYPDLIHATESFHVFTSELGPHKKHDIMPSAIVLDTLPHHEPIWAQGQWSGATAGGVKDQLRSHPSGATKAAAAKRLGKVQQSKSIQGSVKHRPGVQWGRRRQERAWKGVGRCFGLQMSENIGPDPRRGVRTRRKIFLQCRWWRWRHPEGRRSETFSLGLTKTGRFPPFQLSQMTSWVL